MTESSQTPQAPSKSKAFLDYFRSRDTVSPPNGAKGAADPTSNGAAEPTTVDLTEKPTVPEPNDQSKSGVSLAQMEHQWDEAVAGAKSKTNILSKLKRFSSKDGKSAKAKGKEKEKVVEEEPAIEDLAAMIPLPTDGTATPPKLTPIPAATPPADNDSIPGSNTLSKRIQLMLSSVPPFLHTVPDPAQPAPSPVPPLADAKLLGYLSSPDIMNGLQVTPSSTGKPRKSVWQVLDQLVPYKAPVVPAPGSTAGGEDPEEEAAETSLMLCVPLIPNESSKVTGSLIRTDPSSAHAPTVKVELAKSAVITVPETDEEEQALASKVIAKGVATSLWPDKMKLPWWKKKKQKPCDDPAPPPAPPTKPTKEVKVWIPSKTAISFQVAWWGYRLWLPPPVMRILDDKTLEASKRAAMIATALGWLINNIPITAFPPPLLPAVALLKAVVPITGYIGGFIAWSWSQVKSFDKGSGVVLSATWLLPIALIPGSWEGQYESIPIGGGESKPATPAPDPPKEGTTTPSNPKPTTPATPGTGDGTTPQPQPGPSIS